MIWKRWMRRLVLLLITVPISFTAQTEKPERAVRDNIITSEHDPPVQIRLPESTQYVGADRWVLFGIADCELHAFVEADNQRNVRRLYLVQFEGYLRPSRNCTIVMIRRATPTSAGWIFMSIPR